MAVCLRDAPPPYPTNEHEPPPPYKVDWINRQVATRAAQQSTVSEGIREESITNSNNINAETSNPWLIPVESRDPREPMINTVCAPFHEHQSLLGVPPFQAPPSYSSLDVSQSCATVAPREACPPAFITNTERTCSHISLIDSFELYGQISLVDCDGQPVRFGQVKVSVENRLYLSSYTEGIQFISHIVSKYVSLNKYCHCNIIINHTHFHKCMIWFYNYFIYFYTIFKHIPRSTTQLLCLID